MVARRASFASSFAFSIALAVFLCASPAGADDVPADKSPADNASADKPAPPTTQPAADVSTPQGAMLVFIRALEAGDVDKAIATCQLRDDDDKEMLTAVAAATKAHAELRKSIKAKWADDAPGPEVQINGLGRIYSEYDFTDPAITEDGATAKAQLHNNRGTICLTKDQDTWKISLADCMKDYSSYKPTDVARTFTECGEKATDISQRLAANEFESFQALQDTIDKEQKEAAERERKRKRAGL